MKFAHVMVRTRNLETSVGFWTKIMGFALTEKRDYDEGRFTLAFMQDSKSDFILELTYNWDQTEDYTGGDQFGHIAFTVPNIYEFCSQLIEKKINIDRAPYDGHLAFFYTPEGISIELIQEQGPLEPTQPWIDMKNS